MIIGIAGTLGAGKGTVVEYLKDKGFKHYSASGKLKELLSDREILARRESLSKLSDELSDKYEGGVLEIIYKDMQESSANDVILESIHRVSEADYLRSIGAIILGVDADTKTRYERAVKRQEGEKDNVTYEQFLLDIEREEKGKSGGKPNIREVLDHADFVITNNGTIEELHQQVDEFLDKYENK